jgi:HK97 family phage major capsid protein
MRLDFSQTTNLPVQNGRGALAAGFVAENGAIPVKEGSIGTTSLIPKKMGVISAYSKELARRSVPAIMQVIESQIIGDTAEGIDTAFLDATARSTTRPAGLQDTTETVSANINAITNVATGAHGSTVKEILTDTAALLARVWAARMTNGAWVMNPAQRLALEDKQDGTTGDFAFRDEIRAGRFRGYPIIESTNVTAGVTAFVADGAMAFGSELMPYFEQSDQATLHFENSSPTALTTTGSPAVAAFPMISLFQQDLIAIKGIWTLDWRILRAGGVQVLTSTTGW